MTDGNQEFLRERRRIGKRNLKRYWDSQGCLRLAGDKTGLASFLTPTQLKARLFLTLTVILLAVIGLWSVFF